MKKSLQIICFSLLASVNVIAQAPVAHYPLNGNAFDIAGSWSGVISGNPTSATNRLSRANQAMNFDGNGDYIDLPSDFDFPNRTIITWFNFSSLPSGNGNIAYSCDHAGLQHGNSGILVINVGGVPTLHLGSDGASYFDTTVNLNQWYQAAVVRTPSSVKAYLNGSLISTMLNPNGGRSLNGVNHALISTDRLHSSGFANGRIDDILIYNTALSDSAIALNYNAWRDSIVEVTGKIYFDTNQNQAFDVGEQPVRNEVVNIGNDYVALTNNNGDYIVYPLPGTYTITPSLSGDISSFPFSPDSIVVAADSLGRTYADNNFAINAPANYCAASLTIVAITPPARPGFNNRVNVRFVNAISATAVSQTLEFTYPPQQEYVSATPAPTTVDTLNHTITWDITNLSSGSLWQAMVTLYTPPAVAIGSILQMSSLVSNSTCAMLESPFQANEEVIVVGSFDPNDKAVSPVGEAPGGRILPSTSALNYTIRFQNTGTFMAENVNVIDTISALLNISTLRVEAASHNYQVLVDGRVVTFRFLNINLPDSNSNEPMSHGFIKYSIQPSAGFVQNSVVENFADIYFDFNTPVRTNTVQNTADNSVGIVKTKSNSLTFKVFPNPLSSGNWQLITDEKMIGKEIRMFDVTGRQVYVSRIINQRTEIEASQLPQGVYLVKIETSVGRVVKL